MNNTNTSTKSLDDYLKRLEETLEEKPDKWFDNPKGYLLKPDFKRKEQERSIVQSHKSIFSLKSFIGLQYKKRFFMLNYDTKILVYFKDDSCSNELGRLDMTTVIDVAFSKVCDAPILALDLITEDRYYTVVADSHQAMIKWAYAFNLVRKKQIKRVTQQRLSVQAAERWMKYEYTFEEAGPLMINVVGTSNVDKTGQVISNKIVVTSFEYNEDGSPGRAEMSGKIRVNDFLTGVNSVDLSLLTFDDAMDKVIQSSWPKTLHFLRDLAASNQSRRAADWAYVFYPALDKKKRRYVEIHDDCIIFFKPAPGGAASSNRDALIKLNHIASIRPIIDRTMPIKEQHILSVAFKENAVIEIYNDSNEATNEERITTLTFSLENERQFKSWRSILASPTTINGELQNIISMLALENIQDSGAVISVEASDLSVKSLLTGKFSRRIFGLSGGMLKWSRPKKTSSFKSFKSSIKESTMLIANSSTCNVKSVIAFEDIFEKNLSGNVYQLEIQAVNGTSVIMGATEQNTIMEWLRAITEVVNVAPEESRSDVKLSTNIEKDYQAGRSYVQDDDDIDTSNINKDNNNGCVTGILFVKRDALPGFKSLHKQKTFKKCWCVLDGFVLKTFNSAKQNQADLEIDMRAAYEVREIPLPENSIEILLESKNYLFVAEDDDEQMKWLDSLNDCLEARETPEPAATRPSDANDIQYKGTLMYRSINKITGIVTMKKRFFALQKGYLSYYDKEADMVNDKEPLNEISLMQISKIESWDFERCTPDSGIAIHAKVIKGGDDNGDRIFELDAKSPFEAKTWMEEICKATGKFELKPKDLGNGYESIILQLSDKARHASMMMKANASVGQADVITRRSSANILFKRNDLTQLQEENNQTDKDEIQSNAKPLIATAGRRGSTILTSTAGGRGRGRGNRGSIIPHQSSMVPQTDEVDEDKDVDDGLAHAFNKETLQKD